MVSRHAAEHLVNLVNLSNDGFDPFCTFSVLLEDEAQDLDVATARDGQVVYCQNN